MTKTEYEKRTGKRAWSYDFWEIWHGAQDTLFYSWWTPITVFCESCVRTAKWFPIIWKDRHWDHWFILEILRQKIRFQRESIYKYGHHVRAYADCENMRIAELLIKRLQDDDYSDHHMKELEQEFGELDFGERGLRRSKVITEEDEKREWAAHKRAISYNEYMKSQDYDYLFKHLKKHLEKWWD
jgi:hypothetical protein